MIAADVIAVHSTGTMPPTVSKLASMPRIQVARTRVAQSADLPVHSGVSCANVLWAVVLRWPPSGSSFGLEFCRFDTPSVLNDGCT